MKSLFPAIILALTITSCKEQPIQIDLGGNFDNWDSSYISTVEAPQPKQYLLEELTGVRCENCPAAAAVLDQMNEQNGNVFVIVGLNTGSLTLPITGKSIQDFRTEAGDQMRTLIFGGEGNKPAVSFDRLPLSDKQNKYFVESSTNWGEAIIKMKNHASTTPVNVRVMSDYASSDDQYNIEVQVHFTETMQDTLALNIFLIENNIKEAFVGSDTFINYNHVFRDALTPAIGKIILQDYTEKEAGLTYIYRTSLKIDTEDKKQKFWIPGNMEVVAFVSKATPEDKQVFQASKTSLK